MNVRLNSWEIIQAAQAAILRQVENIKLGRKPAHGAGRKNDWQLATEGCLGECALAKALGVYWSGKGRLRAPDVGEVDVRTTTYLSGRLILHDEDPDDRLFYLLTGANGDYFIRGWILGKDGKDPKYWDNPKGKDDTGAYFVPQSALNKMEGDPT